MTHFSWMKLHALKFDFARRCLSLPLHAQLAPFHARAYGGTIRWKSTKRWRRALFLVFA